MKTIFLPLTSSRDGWTRVRSQRLLRFAPDNNIDDNNQTIRCKCGASHPWIGADDPALPKWIDKHGIHMPALPHEPPEHGNLVEEDDAGQTLSMRPALRWPDGRVEVVEQTFDGPPPPSSDELPPDLEEAAKALILEAMRAAHAIDNHSDPTIDWASVAAGLREEAEKLRHVLDLGEEET